jgi:hypothetical protein
MKAVMNNGLKIKALERKRCLGEKNLIKVSILKED